MIILPELPYSKDSLEPHISAETLKFHYEKHHAGYVKKLNELIKDSEFADQALENIILGSYNKAGKEEIFNNAAQVWNHTFYWNCLKKDSDPASEEFADKIKESFGSLEDFKKQIKEAAIKQFGSGWAWLVLNTEDQKLEILKTSNADTPLAHKGKEPLFTIDVWEHAYYLDYQNLRPDYVGAVLENLINWDFIETNYQNAQA